MNKTKLNQSNDSNLDLSAADELLALKLKIKNFCIEFDGTSWGWGLRNGILSRRPKRNRPRQIRGLDLLTLNNKAQ